MGLQIELPGLADQIVPEAVMRLPGRAPESGVDVKATSCKQNVLRPQHQLAITRGEMEEHTSELQSQSNLVCRLLLEKKKRNTHIICYEISVERTLVRI